MTAVFHDLTPGIRRVSVRFGDRWLELPDGMTLAAALLAAGVSTFRRTPASGAPRGPFCMMGACHDCLVLIDGERVQACMTEVRDGLEADPAGGGA